MAKTDISPEQARKAMLKNTAVVETYAQQIQSQIGQLLDLINEFQQGVENGRE